jgi:hypothetical protein
MTDRSPTVGSALVSLYYLSVALGLSIMLLAFVPTMTNLVARWSFFALLGLLAIAAAVGLWRVTTGNHSSTQTGTAEDITYDPFSHPGHAAKHTWRKAIRSLKQQPDDDENE